jgi:DNA repair protein RadD
MTPPDLRPYQLRAIDAARALVRAGKKRIIIVAPTGSGKTVIAASMIHSAVQRGGRVLFLAHRAELLEQCSARLDSVGVEHGIIQAKHWRTDSARPVQVASVQSLVRREKPPATLVFIDECHRARAATYTKILESYPCAVVIGLTATPTRADGKGLGGELFQEMIIVAQPRELIAQGFLVPFAGFGFENPDLSGVHSARGDYVEGELAAAVGTTRIIGGIVERWREHAAGVRTVVFAVNCAHSRQIVESFKAAGIAAEHVDGETPTDERAAILARLAGGETRVVSNVDLLTEGFDLPTLECCVLARPTKSARIFLQAIGRVMRPAPGKAMARIHDHAGALLYHGLPDEDRQWSLSLDQVVGAAKVKQCPACFACYAPGPSACPQCGHKEEHDPNQPARGVEEMQQEILSIDEIRHLRASSSDDKASEFKRLQAVGERLGHAPGWASHEYRRTYAVWPRFASGVLERAVAATAPPMPLDKLRALFTKEGERQ